MTYPNEFAAGASGCQNTVKAINGSATGLIITRNSNGDCKSIGSGIRVGIADTVNAGKAAGTVPATGVDTGSGLTANKSCESEGGILSWLYCPVLKIIDGVTSYLDNQVISLLQIPPSYYATNDRLFNTWARIRNIPLLLLVPIMLIMVLSTALGYNFVDAYTIKRALPRAVAAVMFIVLSWWIMVYMVDLTNDVGKGVLGLLTGAFGGTSNLSLANIFSADGIGAVVQGAAVVGAVAGTISIFVALAIFAPGIIGLIILQAFVTLIGLFIAFIVLALRQMLVITLMLFAPLAILSWIFPNNSKLWKLWWESFSKLLLMFPIIMVIIAAGRIFAGTVPSDSGVFGIILRLIAYIAPYFFIPATFKLAGNLFSTLSGTVNNRSKGLLDHAK